MHYRRTAAEIGRRRLAADRPTVHAAAGPVAAEFIPADVEHFVRNHASETLACDFFVTFTATFRLVYVFLVQEVGTRRILHWNVTEHPSAEWTAQQFRGFRTGDEPYRFVVHDSDAVFSPAVDSVLRSMNLCVLKTPARVPQANAFCERLIGTVRRECLDHLIPLNERHLRKILTEWVSHYNHGRPPASLGPGIPEPSAPTVVTRAAGYQLPHERRVTARPILGGLHHEYRLEQVAGVISCGVQGSTLVERKRLSTIRPQTKMILRTFRLAERVGFFDRTSGIHANRHFFKQV